MLLYLNFMEEIMKSDKLGIIIMEGAEELAEATIKHLLKLNKGLKRSDIVIDVVCPRFSSGEAKGLISRSVRGYDLYIVSDVFNYGVKYEMYGHVNWMSPDDHYQNLKRIVGTVIGLAKKVHVVMPMLYEGRQHRCTARESLDSAVFLRELEMLGVDSFLTFDAHDERVRNAVPFMGFDNISPAKPSNCTVVILSIPKIAPSSGYSLYKFFKSESNSLASLRVCVLSNFSGYVSIVA